MSKETKYTLITFQKEKFETSGISRQDFPDDVYPIKEPIITRIGEIEYISFLCIVK